MNVRGHAGLSRKHQSFAIKFFCAWMFLAGWISVQGATITWTNAAGGNWSAAANWSPNQTPGPGDTAVIMNAGDYTVTLDVSPTIAGLVLGATSGANTQTLLVNGQTLFIGGPATVNSDGQLNFNSGTLAGRWMLAGALNWSGGHLNSGSSLTVASNGVLNIEGSVNIEVPLTNYGTVNWQAGAVTVNDESPDSGAIWNQPGGQWNIQCDQNMGAESGDEPFNNAGTVLKTAGTNSTTIQVDFNNTGMLDAESGTIQFYNNATLGGSIEAAANAAVYFSASRYTILAGLNFQGPGPVQINSGVLAGTLSGTLNWSGGNLFSSSSLTVTSNGVLNIQGNVGVQGPLTNYGTVNWQAGTVTVNDESPDSGAIWNQPGGQWNIQCDQNMGAAAGDEPFNNAGTMLKTAGTNSTTIQVDFNNTGLVNVQSGTISLEGSYALTNGTLDFGISDPANYGRISLSGAASFTGNLGVNLNGFYWPPVGSSFNLLSYASETGVLFTSTVLPPFITWQTDYNPTVFTLAVIARQTNTAPANLTMSLSGHSNLNLAWPGDHTGWQLEVQTNPVAVGISTNWVIVPGSDLTNEMTVPVGLNNGAVFFRLVYP